jgi:ATP-binding cassette subfamily B multidrug efflux pump
MIASDINLAFSMQDIDRFSVSSLLTRTTNDITKLQMFVALGLPMIIQGPILAVWAILKIMGKSWQWTTATGFAVLAAFIMLLVIIIFAMPKFKAVQMLTDNLSRVARENLTGLRVVRSFNADSYEENKFEKANAELTSANLFANRIQAIMQPGMTLIMSSLSLAVYWIGGILLNNAGMADRLSLFGDMVVFSAYAVQVVMAFMRMGMMLIMLTRASVSAARIEEVFRVEPTVIDGQGAPREKDSVGEVEFRHVSFKYPDAADYVLKDVSFTARKGETVAFIGSTGSGKSTLINLIPRFYDVTEGEVLVDGVNVKDYAGAALHDKIGYVPQKAVLFSGTIGSNISYGTKDATEADIHNAVSVAQGAEFVNKMEGRIERSHSAGRQEHLRRAKAAAVHSAGGLPQTGNLHSGRFLFRAGLQNRPGTTPRSEKQSRRRYLPHRRAANRHHQGRGQDHRIGRGENCGNGNP